MSVENKLLDQKNILHKLVWTAGFLFLLVILALGLAWAASGFTILLGWDSFFWVLLLSSGILFGVWRLLRDEKPPRWLFYILVGAALLRLAMGTLWFTALPDLGAWHPGGKSRLCDGRRSQAGYRGLETGAFNQPAQRGLRSVIAASTSMAVCSS